ncbi:MAG: hypothetical protein AABY42_00720, partial [Nitrospirota bacterium]
INVLFEYEPLTKYIFPGMYALFKVLMKKKLKALFHLNEEGKWAVVLLNVSNFLKDIGEDNGDVVIIANGSAVIAYAGSEGYIGSERLKTMNELSKKGVKFLACRNAINEMCSEGFCIEADALPSFVETIPVGITEIIKRQHSSYAYVKP